MARKMKDSGIEWIGEIPEGWEVIPAKFLFKNSDIRRIADDEQLTSSQQFGIISQKDYTELTGSKVVLANKGLADWKHVEPFDFIISLRSFQGGLEMSEITGCITWHYIVLKPCHKICSYYYKWLFKSDSYIRALQRTCSFIRDGQDLRYSNFIQVPLFEPPLAEQEKIADYLNAECFRIDAMLTKTRTSIEEYKKLKQAVITQAVTKGVRGERGMKDSGNPWFGQIPTDWKLSRVGLHFSIILGKMLCNAPLNDTYTLEPYYCAADVHFDGVADGERKKMWFSPIEKDLYIVSVGDLLVVEGGAGAGGSAIVEKQDSDTYVQNSIMIVRSKGNADSRYLRYLLEFLVKQGYIDVVCNKATIPHFTKDKLSCVPFCLCPAGEQKEIADHLDAKCAEIDRLIAKKEQLVKELESYKKSLIYEVVTGKREV
mgnify:CR=1 FL=1